MKDRDYRRKQRERILTPEENTVHLMRTGQLEIVNEYTATKAEDIATRISLAAGLADIVPYQISNTEYLEISPPTIADYLGLARTSVEKLTISVLQISGLSDAELRLFAADCAERVLSNFETTSNDPSPRQAIETARRYALGQATRADLSTANFTAHPNDSVIDRAAVSAAWSAGFAAWPAAESAAGYAAHYAVEAVKDAVRSIKTADWSVVPAEISWQKQRLAQYLLKLVPIG